MVLDEGIQESLNEEVMKIQQYSMLRQRSNAISTQLDHIKDIELKRKEDRDIRAASLFGQISVEDEQKDIGK